MRWTPKVAQAGSLTQTQNEVFARKADQNALEAKDREKELFEEIGRLKMELEWLKKKSWRARALRSAAARLNPNILRCRSSGSANSSAWHLRLMRMIDETYLAYPVFGSRQMTRWLRRQGYAVNGKRVRRLMQQMGLEAIYQKPNLSRKHLANPVFRYLLRGLVIDRPNQVWAMDIMPRPGLCRVA